MDKTININVSVVRIRCELERDVYREGFFLEANEFASE